MGDYIFRVCFTDEFQGKLLSNFAKRTLDEHRFPTEARLFRTEPDVQVLVHTQRPQGAVKGEVVMVHGLEGSSAAGYMRSLSQLLLENGYAVYRSNMRSCGGTESLCKTMYHAGLTSDTLSILREIRSFQCSFSVTVKPGMVISSVKG